MYKTAKFVVMASLAITWLALQRSSTGIAADAPEFRGRPLHYWAAQAGAADRAESPDDIVAALSMAVRHENPSVKVAAADALAVLGPGAKAAVPTLLDQFGHEVPWVRVSCQAAVASVGREAVAALIDTFEKNTGGPRIRAAFVLGSIGADAKAAVPVLVAALPQESTVVQDRLRGVLSQIDPEAFPPKSAAKKAQFDPNEAGVAGEIRETSDWPQFHGPARDSICRDRGLLRQWPEDGPALLWTLEGLGRGYSTVSIAAGKLFTMGDLPDGDAESQFVLAFDLQTRQRLWTTRVGPANPDGGPRCTPTVDGDRLFVLGTESDLACLNVADGSVVWQKNLAADFGAKSMSVWKFSESPLVDGHRLICTPGGPEAAMIALDKGTGELIWKCAMPDIGNEGNDGAGYSSVVVADICGVRQYVQMLGRGVIGVEAETGRFLWGYNRIANTVANITSPVVRGNYVFATTAYNTGSVLLKIARDGDAMSADEVYFLEGRDFQNHHGGVVLIGDHIFGGNGPNKGDPVCIEFGTGKILWKERAPARGSAAVVYADGHLVFRYDRGDVVLIEASPDELRIKGKFTAPVNDGPAWPHPVIHQGKLYLRHSDILLCYDLRAI